MSNSLFKIWPLLPNFFYSYMMLSEFCLFIYLVKSKKLGRGGQICSKVVDVTRNVIVQNSGSALHMSKFVL